MASEPVQNLVQSLMAGRITRRDFVLRLSALGCVDLESHQSASTESFTRMRRTVTHSAGAGSLAGLCQ